MADGITEWAAQEYLNWLFLQLHLAKESNDALGLGDPYKKGSDANLMIQKATSLLQSLPEGTPWPADLPFIGDYLKLIGQMYPAQEVSPVMGMTDVLGNRQLYRDAAGNYYNIDGNPVDSATVTKIIAAYFDSPESEVMTPYQEAEISIALQRLSQEQYEFGNLSEYQQQQLAYAQQQLTWEQQQYQTLSASQQAQLGLSQQQLTLQQQQLAAETAARQAELELEQRQWLADIMANPANWIEAAYGSMLAGGTGMEGWPTKWYAENLPYGATMPTWGVPAGAGGVTGGVAGGIPIGGVTGGIAGAEGVPFSAMEGAIPTVGAGGVPLSKDTQDLYGALYAAEENVVRLNQMGAPQSVIVGAAAETELIRAQLYLSERADESAYFGIQPTAEPYSQIAAQLQQVAANPQAYSFGDLNYILTGNVGPGMQYYAPQYPSEEAYQALTSSPEFQTGTYEQQQAMLAPYPEWYAQTYGGQVPIIPTEATWMPQEEISYPTYEPQMDYEAMGWIY